MPKTKMPSPARSQGDITTPKRKKSRGSRSLCSPALSTASGRLTSLIDQFKDKNMESFALSPLNGRSVLNDNTDIGEPRRKSWWKKLDENSQDVMDVLEDSKVTDANNVIEEFIDIEVLSQEKVNYTLDLPESSDNESINSIVLPQRRLFMQKENQPQKKFGQLVSNRETLAKLHKTNTTNIDKTINVGTRELFQNVKRSKPIFPAALLNISPNKTATDKTKENIAESKPTRELFQNTNRSKPVFPAALLNISPNKTAADKTKENIEAEPKPQVRNIFGNRVANKRKNIFADFIVSESEDEISDIQPKVFGFQKKLQQRRISSVSKGRDASPASSVTTDIEMDDWKLLPSSTMVEIQLEDNMVAGTPIKQARLSKLSEAKESELGTNSLQTNTTAEKSKQSKKSISSKNNSKSASEVKNTTLNNSRLTRSMLKNASKREDVNTSIKQDTKDKSQNRNTEVLEKDSQEDGINKSSSTNKSLQQVQKPIKTIEEYVESQQNDQLSAGDNVDGNQENNQEQETSQNQGSENEDNVNKEAAEVAYENQEGESTRNENDININKENTEDEVNIVQENENDANDNEDEINVSQENEHNENQEDLANKSQEVDNEVIENEEGEDEANESDNDKDINEDEANESQEVEAEANESLEISKQANESLEVEAEANESLEMSKEANESQEVEAEANESLEISKQANESLEVEAEANESLEMSKEANESEEVEAEANESQELEAEAYQNKDVEQEVEDDDASDEENDDEIDENEEEAVNESRLNEASANESREVENEEEEANHKVESEADVNESEDIEDDQMEDSDEADKAIATDADMSEQDDDDIQADEMEVDDDDPEDSENVNESDQNQDESHEEGEIDVQNEPEPSAEEIEESPNVTHDTTGRNRKKELNNSPEVILNAQTDQMDSFSAKGRNTSMRKTKSIIKNLDITPSLAPPRDSIGFSDGTTNSSAQGSGWDSHRTTRKTLRKTFGKDFSLRKSLRALVMEKSAKRQTEHVFRQEEHLDLQSETVNIPQANSTEFPEDSNRDVEDFVESDHEVSRRTRQTTLEMYLQKMKQQNLEKRLKMEEAVRNSLKVPVRDSLSLFKVPNKPAPRRPKPAQSKPKKQIKSIIPFDELPSEMIEDMKYKPPKKYRPTNASWITKRFYKFLESKLEAKYDYKARIRAEKLAETIYHFTKDLRRHHVAPADAVDVLKHELARLDVVHTHFEFYEFFHEFMPREVRIKVVPDIVNNIPLPRHGVFSDILR